MTGQEAKYEIIEHKPIIGFPKYVKALNIAINALEEVEQYRAIGTVEELQKAEKEENILKFYYCDSEDNYLVGLRIDNFYYAHYIDGRWVFDMSRHLPWGKHVVDDATEWKEYTYPSEPREISFSEWLNGFIKKECGGTPEECQAAVEKQKAKKANKQGIVDSNGKFHTWNGINGKPYLLCPNCGTNLCCEMPYDKKPKYCDDCGQKLDWSDEEWAD